MLHLSIDNHQMSIDGLAGVNCPRCNNDSGMYVESGRKYRLFFFFPFLSINRRTYICKNCKKVSTYIALPGVGKSIINQEISNHGHISLLQKIDITFLFVLVFVGVIIPLVPIWAGISIWTTYSRQFKEPNQSIIKFLVILGILSQIGLGAYLIYKKMS